MNRIGVATYGGSLLGNNIMNPQQQFKWMDKPAGDADPLAHLKLLDSLLVKQIVSMTEFITGLPSQAKYGVFNSKGEQVYFAFEESDTCQRFCCTTTRSFVLHVVDSTNQELIRISRDFRCCAGIRCCACSTMCKQEVVVESPPGTIVGHVSQECSCIRASYTINNATNQPVMQVVGPLCICDGAYACCCENKFTIYGTDGSTEIGAVFKKYRGFFAEALTSADMFTIQIPMNLDVKMKAVALGALFLIDFAHYSEPPDRKNNTFHH